MALAWAKTVKVFSDIPSPAPQSEASTAPDPDGASWEMRAPNATCSEDGAYSESPEISTSGSAAHESSSTSPVLPDLKASCLLRRRPHCQIEDLRISSTPDRLEGPNFLRDAIGQPKWKPGVGWLYA